SIWPTELIRLLTFVLSMWFGALTLKAIELEPGKPNGEFFPGDDRRKEAPSARLYHWRKLYLAHRESVDAGELWREFRSLEEPAARLRRLWLPLVLYVLMSGGLWLALGGRPAVPCRGEFACGIDAVVTGFSGFAFLVLMFLVVDSI